MNVGSRALALVASAAVIALAVSACSGEGDAAALTDPGSSQASSPAGAPSTPPATVSPGTIELAFWAIVDERPAQPADCETALGIADQACSAAGDMLYILSPSAGGPAGVVEADAYEGVGPDTDWVVSVRLDDTSTAEFFRVTADVVFRTPPRNQVAVLLDGVVVTAAVVNEAVPGGMLELGGFTQAEAEEIAAGLVA